MSITGTFTISLNFELLWGVEDRVSAASYGGNIIGARDAIPRMLQLFDRYGVHCTWATVGLLMFDRKADLIDHLPELRPRYADPILSPYPRIGQLGPNERQDPYHFGLSLIELIRDCPGQEIGTHTFSHYYCMEPGQTEESQTADTFRADLIAARRAAERLKITPNSLVFPRNQFRADYLGACRDAGIEVVRGNQRSRIYQGQSRAQSGMIRRLCRKADDYLPVFAEDCTVAERLEGGVIDLRASRFLRPAVRRLRPLEPLRLHRINRGLSRAAKDGTVYHLWWHPHNVGVDTDHNLHFLERILKHYRHLSERYGMRSQTMLEIARDAARTAQPAPDAAAAATREDHVYAGRLAG